MILLLFFIAAAFANFEESDILLQSDPDTIYRFQIPKENITALYFHAHILGSDATRGSLYATINGLIVKSGDIYVIKHTFTPLLQGDGTMYGTSITLNIVNGDQIYITKDLVGAFDTRWSIKGFVLKNK